VRIIFVLVAAGAAAFIWLTGQGLPPVVASHFGPGGVANSFMPRTGYLALMVLLGIGLPAVGVVQFGLVLRRPGARINLPNGAYWLAPERAAATLRFLTEWFAVFPTLVVVLICDVQFLVVRANTVTPVQMDMRQITLALVGFAVATVIWLAALFARFARV